MTHNHQTSSDERVASQQATTTTFDVVQSRDIVQQLTGNAPGIYRKSSRPARFVWIARFFRRFRRNR